MNTVFGTPIHIFNADDRDNKTTKDGDVTITSKLQDTLKTLLPLNKARAAVQNAIKALDGTAYEAIRKTLEGAVQSITDTEQKVVAQISGTAQAEANQKAPAQTNPAVPTAGQISGREPLPGEPGYSRNPAV